MDESGLDEHVFCLSVSSFSSFIREFANELLDSRGKPSDMIEPTQAVRLTEKCALLFWGVYVFVVYLFCLPVFVSIVKCVIVF